MSHKSNDELYEARQEWLDELGRTEGDIMSDESGKYVMSDNDGEESRGYAKLYLPDNFQELK